MTHAWAGEMCGLRGEEASKALTCPSSQLVCGRTAA